MLLYRLEVNHKQVIASICLVFVLVLAEEGWIKSRRKQAERGFNNLNNEFFETKLR